MLRPQFIDEDPATFHHRDFTTAVLQNNAALWVPVLTQQKTLVLGSSQPEDSIDSAELAATGVDLARRRSGGGAVLVSRDDLIWFDVVIGRTHHAWDDDVVRSFDWLGRATQRAVRTVGHATDMHEGRLRNSPWSPFVCFAGLGPGELTIRADDGSNRKVVGISQRRTRDRARFQVAILKRWSGAEHGALLSASTDATATELDAVAHGIDVSDIVIDAVAEELSRDPMDRT